MRIYVSGPISGVEDYQSAFDAAKVMIKAAWPESTVILPNEIPPYCLSHNLAWCGGDAEGHTWECWMKEDLIVMMSCDLVALIPGWGNSKGAQVEAQLAVSLGIEVKTLAEIEKLVRADV